jgi:outer membrane protein OmpA-like peptidoglycan-associated protein
VKAASFWMALTLTTGMLAGCATSPEDDSELNRLGADLQALKNNADVQAHAPNAVLDAEQTLAQAERAVIEDDGDARDHYVYLTKRHLDIARVSAERGALERDIQALGEERDRLALGERESELAEQRQRTRELGAELAALEAQRTDRGMLLKLDDVFFQTDSANIAPGATPTVDQVAGFLTRNEDQHIIVEGHTDSVGDAGYNQDLSSRRAEAVKDLIVARGIEPERIVTRGYGESRPIASNQNAGGRQLNRRVEIVFPDTVQ